MLSLILSKFVECQWKRISARHASVEHWPLLRHPRGTATFFFFKTTAGGGGGACWLLLQQAGRTGARLATQWTGGQAEFDNGTEPTAEPPKRGAISRPAAVPNPDCGAGVGSEAGAARRNKKSTCTNAF